MRCECGCGWEGEDDLTQYLVEECAMLMLEVVEANEERKAAEEHAQSHEDVERAERLRAMAARQIGR